MSRITNSEYVLSSSIYVQKSKLFLLPLTELVRDKFIKPKGTFIADEYRGIKPEDYRLLVAFEKEDSSEFSTYESNFILKSQYLDTTDYYETSTLRVYVFNLDDFKEDYDDFLKGQYTDFSTRTKGLINIYWGDKRGPVFYPHPRIEAYLSPTSETYEQVARELNVEVNTLYGIEQLIDPPDLEKELFKGKGIKHTGLNELELES